MMHVASVHFKCFRCFRGMLQVFHKDVVKVERDVAMGYTLHVCFKCMFQIFHLFRTYIVRVSLGCCKTRSGCYIYICKCFRCFRTYVASVLS
jgi:hypothetical protein